MDTTADAPTGPSADQQLSDFSLKLPQRLWSLVGLLLLVLVGWAFFDPRFDVRGSHAYDSFDEARLGVLTGTQVFNIAGSFFRFALHLAITTAILGILVFLALGLVWGAKQYRSLKAFLMFVTLVSLCVGLLIGLPNVAWYGKQMRVGRLLSTLYPCVAELQDDWPLEDGRSSTLGPYMAYPIGGPTALVLLSPPVLGQSTTKVSMVERSETGALRFLLAGTEFGDWLEFHPDGHLPSSFVGGLLQHFELSRYQDLGDGWYLVRYD